MDSLWDIWWWSAATGISILAVLFLLKMIWNVGTPYVILRRQSVSGDRRPKSISMHPFVDLMLLVVACVLGILSGQDGVYRPSRVALAGITLIVASYSHLGIVFLVHRHVQKFQKRP